MPQERPPSRRLLLLRFVGEFAFPEVNGQACGTGGPAAEKSEMPGFIKPQLANLKANAPAGDQWLHEIEFDGYRIQIHLNRGKRKVYTRNGLDWTKRFSVIAGAISGQALVDSEVVVHDGRTNS
jgi:ATP-dependent DNA ligase